MKTSFVFLFIVILSFNTSAQSHSSEYSLLFYNVENLFDTQNDSLTADEAFTAKGERHWTSYRLADKLRKISKAIVALSQWHLPSVIALCEIENRYVLERLRSQPVLKSANYKIVHKDSPDDRGIDVAVLYQPETFYPLEYDYFPVEMENGQMLQSREILYLKGIVGGTDTIHLLVNHWPSRYGGVMETKDLRIAAAKTLRKRIDRIHGENDDAKLIILGDFNDQPDNESISKYLGAKNVGDSIENEKLYNLSYLWAERGEGTLKYKAQWFVFDQIIVSGSMLKKNNGLYTQVDWARIGRLPFLEEPDQTHGGMKPFRTYHGYSYNDGFSDHFPVLLKLAH